MYLTLNRYKINKTEDEWKSQLSKEQFYILREKGTELPYSGDLNKKFEDGIYTCAACKTKLFDSSAKFDSACGWPSFDRSLKGQIEYSSDKSHGMNRTEILCNSCGGHLGHVFNDGPTKTGIRYCVNSLSLDFKKS